MRVSNQGDCSVLRVRIRSKIVVKKYVLCKCNSYDKRNNECDGGIDTGKSLAQQVLSHFQIPLQRIGGC